MPNLNMLSTMIAIVVVLLVLSLIVQSIQTFVKKLLKIKSHAILNSLEDLFENVLNAPPDIDTTPGIGAAVKRFGQSIAFWRRTPAPAAPGATVTPHGLVQDVVVEFKRLGRVSLFNNVMLDSVAKNDVLKVLAKLGATDLAPNFVAQFPALLGKLDELQAALVEIDKIVLTGDASANYAALRATLSPLLSDLAALREGDTTALRTKAIFGDLLKLREVKLDEVFGLLGQVQQTVGQDLAAAQTAATAARTAAAARVPAGGDLQGVDNDPQVIKTEAAVTTLTELAKALDKVAKRITALGQAFGVAFANLRARLNEVEVWYDTVMQGFEERYTRHMKSIAVAIGFVVVVLLNANFFTIYTRIASNPAVQAKGEQIGQGFVDQRNTQPPAQPPADITNTEQLKQAGQQTRKDVDTNVAIYESLGFQPLTWTDANVWFDSVRGRGPGHWGDERKKDLRTLLGWSLTAMLLSIGAPFWQDVLESLFGVKNLLRKRSDTKNIEDKGGQPNP